MKEIKLVPESEVLIEEIFSRYTESDESFPFHYKVANRIVLHLYPTGDTRYENGELDGFNDALFFDMHIYDVKTATKWIVHRRDELEINVPCRVRFFKDGSAMIILDEGEITLFQSVSIKRGGKSEED